MNLNRLARRLRPADRCEHTTETWGPHDGCAEFMTEPEVMQCTAQATRLVSTYLSEAFGRCVSHDRMCARHAALTAQADANSPYVEAVAVRPLRPSRAGAR